jgi:hypothetical protein
MHDYTAISHLIDIVLIFLCYYTCSYLIIIALICFCLYLMFFSYYLGISFRVELPCDQSRPSSSAAATSSLLAPPSVNLKPPTAFNPNHGGHALSFPHDVARV